MRSDHLAAGGKTMGRLFNGKSADPARIFSPTVMWPTRARIRAAALCGLREREREGGRGGGG